MAEGTQKHLKTSKICDRRRGMRFGRFQNSELPSNWRKPSEVNTESFSKTKYPLGSDVDRETIFKYPFVIDDGTITFIQQHDQIMFIIRGPPSTGKATLSDMLINKYPSAIHCCADHYFVNSFSTPDRNRESMAASHEYCQNKAKKACMQNKSPIVIQNTHIRKWEMQYYLDLAATYSYTVIMIITMYKFDVTPKALERCNTDGLKFDYCKNRLKQWEDVIPVLTGWFTCPQDALYLLSILQEAMEAVLSDGKFCRFFEVYDADALGSFFRARRLLYCVGGYSQDVKKMKNYYLSREVQECYGKCYDITIKGYVISKSGILGLVHVTKDMEHLMFTEFDDTEIDISNYFSSFQCNDNLSKHGRTIVMNQEKDSLPKSVVLEDWLNEDNTVIDFQTSAYIHMAQTDDHIFNPKEVRKNFPITSATLDVNNCQFIEADKGFQIFRLANNEWFVKAPQKIKVKTIFTGLYI